jgi:hypothetical protein
MPATENAVIVNGAVDNIVVVDTTTEDGQAFEEAVTEAGQTIVDISAITPQPGIGWTTTDGGKTFTAPAPAPAPAPSPQAQAAEELQQMASADIPAFTAQITADANTITSTGWGSLTAANQQAILLRIVNGFSSVIAAIQTHAVATGTLPPPTGNAG